MSFCIHVEFKGTKKCPRCYPNHGESVGVVSKNFLTPDDKDFVPRHSYHIKKKNGVEKK